jgi:hypothetical protein
MAFVAGSLVSVVARADTPGLPDNDFDQGPVCEATLRRHAASRVMDLDAGKIRWQCGDVPGVEGVDRGQEYCEYHAIAMSEPSAPKTEYGCLFVATFYDYLWPNRSEDQYYGDPSPAPRARHKLALATALESAGVPKSTVVDLSSNEKLFMKSTVNSISAAKILVDALVNPDAILKARPRPYADFNTIEFVRKAACYIKAIGAGNADAIRTVCKEQPLVAKSSGRWTGLGVTEATSGDALDWQQDLATCMESRILQEKKGAAVSWRNSDALIYTRGRRAANECKAEFDRNALDALAGFTITGWTGALPTGCSYVAPAGLESYKQMVLCKLTEDEQNQLKHHPVYPNDAQAFCRARFGDNLVMEAPLHALIRGKRSGNKAAGFCTKFDAGMVKGGMQ